MPPSPTNRTDAPYRTAAHLIELYCDEFALIPAMHYHWGSELGEATARARFCGVVGSHKLGNLAPADRSRIDGALADTAWPELLAYAPRHRICKDGFKIVFDPN